MGKEAQTSPGLPSPPPQKQNIRALTAFPTGAYW